LRRTLALLVAIRFCEYRTVTEWSICFYLCVERRFDSSLPAAHFVCVCRLTSIFFGAVFLKELRRLLYSSDERGFASRSHGNLFRISLFVEETSAVIDPVVVVSSTELDGKLSHRMRASLYVVGNLCGMDDSSRPPTMVTKLHPDNLVVERHPASLAVVAVIMSFGSFRDVQTFCVETRRTTLATDERSSLGANKAPVGVQVRRHLQRLALAAALTAPPSTQRSKVLWADDLSRCDLNGSGGDAKVARVVGSGTADAADQGLVVPHERLPRVV
jgi:hypothetical protein